MRDTRQTSTLRSGHASNRRDMMSYSWGAGGGRKEGLSIIVCATATNNNDNDDSKKNKNKNNVSNNETDSTAAPCYLHDARLTQAGDDAADDGEEERELGHHCVAHCSGYAVHGHVGVNGGDDVCRHRDGTV